VFYGNDVIKSCSPLELWDECTTSALGIYAPSVSSNGMTSLWMANNFHVLGRILVCPLKCDKVQVLLAMENCLLRAQLKSAIKANDEKQALIEENKILLGKHDTFFFTL